MDRHKAFILDVARLTIAAAWVDGDLANDEVNSLKELLWNLDEVGEDEWQVLEMYLDSPVGEDETKVLLDRVLDGIHSNEQKTLVIDTLTALFEADGVVTDEEAAFLDEIKSAVLGTSTGVFSLLSKAMKSALSQRESHARATCLREADIADYVGNTVYYQLQREQEASGTTIDLPEAEARKLCLAAGIMAHVAAVDSGVSDAERSAIRDIIAGDWKLQPDAANLLAGIACGRSTKGLDYLRLAHTFFEVTSIEERQRFLGTLFRVANASEGTSHDEIEEIRRIGKSLKLSHQDFIAAKLTVPSEDRGGL